MMKNPFRGEMGAGVVVLLLHCLLFLTPPSLRAQSNHLVRMGNYFFDPAILTLRPGDLVTWTNVSTTPHDSHQDTNLWDGPLLSLGQTWSLPFTNPGFYPYYCTPHLGQNQTGSVTVASAPVNLAPLVSLGNPANGSSFTAPARLNLTATASDPDGTIVQVQFFTENTQLAQVTSPPYKFTWDNVPAGTYALTARATDNGGASSTSAVVQITVTGVPGPVVTITSPTNGSVIPAPGSFDLTATVARGAATQVEFFDGPTRLGVDTTNPYRLTIDQLSPGLHQLSAVATDDQGQRGTNTVSVLINLRPTLQITSPGDGAGFLAPATFTLEATAADADGSVANIQLFRGTSLLATLASASGGFPVRGLAAGTYTFTATATDNLGSQSSQAIQVIVKNRPTLTVATPAANARLTNTLALLSGTAADSVQVDAVEYSLNDGPFLRALGTTNWSRSLGLPAGTNVLRFRSLDRFGHSSLTNTRSVFQVSPSPLTLTLLGRGTVTGATNGQQLEVGRGYQLAALPAPGYLFSNWTGQVAGELPRLAFRMQSNLVVQANFVPNPFLAVNGSFHGLFSEKSNVRHATSGEFRLNVAPSGRYSATLQLGGRRLATSGILSLNGQATNTLLRAGTNPVVIRWSVDLRGASQVTGTLTDGSWTSFLEGARAPYHAVTNRAPMMGKHTVILEQASTPDLPIGDGWATLTVTPAGLGQLAGSLADGTRLSRAVPVCGDGHWPLYASLYGNLGSILGWIRFPTNSPQEDLGGEPWWFRPRQPAAPRYPSGFALQPVLTGSRYLAPASPTNTLLPLTNATVVLTGGNLSQIWSNHIIFGPNSRVTNASPNPLSVVLSPGNGLFRGSFTDTNLKRTVTFTGALLQKTARGAGWFAGTNLTGQVQLEASP